MFPIPPLLCVSVANPPAIVDLQRIGDAAPHSAFTDLLRHQGRWYCAFREGQGHVSPDGAIRVLTSADGMKWEPAARVSNHDADLRDPKLCATPDGRLMLTAAAALAPPSAVHHQTLAWFSGDGRNWGEPVKIGDPDIWLWRVTWHQGVAYGVGYSTNTPMGQEFVRLYSSREGKSFRQLADRVCPKEYPNEHSLLFLADDTALCLLRRDGGPATAQLGTAQPPYREWQWRDLGVKIGGPQLLRLPDGRIAAGVRLYDGKVRTALCWLDPAAGKLTPFLDLPSGGDTSYPGLVWHDGLLWVSYYSSHEGKTCVYLARVLVPLR